MATTDPVAPPPAPEAGELDAAMTTLLEEVGRYGLECSQTDILAPRTTLVAAVERIKAVHVAALQSTRARALREAVEGLTEHSRLLFFKLYRGGAEGQEAQSFRRALLAVLTEDAELGAVNGNDLTSVDATFRALTALGAPQ